MTIARQLAVDPEAPTVPVLPVIEDVALEQQVFTHSSALGNPTTPFEHQPGTAKANNHLAVRKNQLR